MACCAGQPPRGRRAGIAITVNPTAPFMHDGSAATLEEVVEYYDSGGRASPLLDPELRPLRLTVDERRALVAFLASLSGRVQEGSVFQPVDAAGR